MVFKSGHVMVTTVERAAVEMAFNAIGYNPFDLLDLSIEKLPSDSFRRKREKVKRMERQ
jgi:hypothetical protein